MDEIMDSTFDRKVYIAKINTMINYLKTQAVDGIVAPTVIREYLFESGEWNDHNPYIYDLESPLKTNLAVEDNELLYKTIDTKIGRCVTMTVLYDTLLYYTGHPVTFGVDPSHIYVIYMANDDPYDDYALETSDKGKFFRDREFDLKRPQKMDQNKKILSAIKNMT